MKTCLATLVLAVGLCGACAFARPSANDEFDPLKFAEYKAKAEQGCAEAQYNLGVCYFKGEGVEKDAAVAVQWYRKAAEQGCAEAQYNLGGCYARGIGVEKDEVEAYKWYLLAAALGNEHAKDDAPLLEMLLTPDQISEGKHRTDQFKPHERTHP